MSSNTSPHYLHISPESTLPFTYIPKRYLTSSIKLTNPTSIPIAFKIRTNAPFSYLVKPRQGLLLPQCSSIIDITMQPSDIDPHNTSISDKFLINACPVPNTQGAANLNVVFSKTDQALVQTDRLKVALRVENMDSQESNSETRDTSMCENSPTKEGKEGKREGLEMNEKQGSELSDMNASFCSTLEPLNETIRSNLNMMKKCQSLMEIEPRKKIELNEKIHSEMNVGEKREEQVMKIEENKIWMEKIIEHRDKLKKHLEEIKKVNCVGEKVQKFAQGLSVKGDYKWQIFAVVAVVMIYLAIGSFYKVK